MSTSKIKLNTKTNYWLYVLTKNNYDDFKKYKGNFITFMDGDNIKKGDVVIIFCKERLNSGFAGIVQMKNDVIINKNKGFVGLLKTNQYKDIGEPNQTHKIFKDNNLNRDYGEVSFKKNFIDLIRPDMIIKSLNTDASGYKNTMSFRGKYLKKENVTIKLDLYGNKIVDKLLETAEQDEEEEAHKQQKKKEEEQEQSDSDDIEFQPSPKKPSRKELDKLKKIEQIKKLKAKPKIEDYVKKYKEKNNIVICSDDEDEDLDDASENKDQSDDEGTIPIMIVPCKDYDFDELLDQNKYFQKHYKKCKKCDITNNNNSDILQTIDKAEVEVIEITSEKHGYFNPALDAYFSLKKYVPMTDEDKENFIRVIYINNDHEIYNGCLLVAYK